jgi:hypothetical protein
MIVLVRIDTFDCIVFLEVIFDKKVKDFNIDRYLRKTYEDPTRDFLHSDLIKPGVFSDVRNFVTFLWVCV